VDPAPAEEPRWRAARGDERLVREPVLVPADRLDADQSGLRTAEIAPPPGASEHRAFPVDAIEEVVRRQEGEVAAEVPVRLDDVVHVRRHVLLVPREDDEVVKSGEAAPALQALEIVVREEVHLSVRPRQPLEETELVAAEVERNAVVEERAGEVDAVARIGVPGVADAVAVHIAKVVRLPGVRGQDDRDPRLSEATRPQHERCEAEPASGRREPRKIEAARPGADRQP